MAEVSFTIGCVRLVSLGDPGVWRFFLPGRTCADNIITHVRPGEKTPHTGVDPGKLNERTH